MEKCSLIYCLRALVSRPKQIATQGVKMVLPARDEKRGLEATSMLHSIGLTNAAFHQLDVLDLVSVDLLAKFIKENFGRFDILRIRSEDLRNELGNVDTLTEENLEGI